MGIEYSFLESDVKTSLTEDQNDNGRTEFTDKFRYNKTSALIGLNLPLLRIWGSYIFRSTLTDLDDNNGPSNKGLFSKNTLYKGNGFGIGMGLEVLPLININIQYNKLTMSHKKNGTISITDQLDELKINEFLIGIGYPINI